MFDLLNEIGQTLRRNKLRTALTGFSVSWGVFMTIVLLGFFNGTSKQVAADFDKDRYGNMLIYGGYTSKPYKGFKEGRSIDLEITDAAAIERRNRSIARRATETNYSRSFTVKGPVDNISGSMEATNPRYLASQRLKIAYGRSLNEQDLEQRRRVMLLPRKSAATLFGAGNEEKALGKTVTAMDLGWTIVGVYDRDWYECTYIPFTTYRSITGNSYKVEQIMVDFTDLESEAEATEAEEEIRSTVASIRQFDPSDQGALWTHNRLENYFSSRNALNYMILGVWVLGILLLLTGMVGVSNIMFVSVRERTHEIGIRRAIGAKPRSIITQVICESIAITALFGYIGVFFGMVVLEIVGILTAAEPIFGNPRLDLSLALQITVALVIAGCISGFFPARRALKIRPVEALRDE